MPNSQKIQVFTLIRRADSSGVSGSGWVLDGILFPNGQVVVCWRAKFESIGVYESFEAFYAIHIDSHPGNNTKLVWMEYSDDLISKPRLPNRLLTLLY